METVLRGVRLDVASSLYLQYQKSIARLGHDPELREQIEHALTLVLNEKRSADSPEHLLRNVRRDARRILRRRQASLPVHEQFDVHEELLGSQIADPEQMLLAKERYLELVALARDIGPDATSCMEGLMEDDSIEDSVSRFGLAPRRVRYMRTQLRTKLLVRMRTEEDA